MIESVQYTDEDNGAVVAVINGVTISVSVGNDDNRHWWMILDWLATDPVNNVIAAYVRPPADLPQSNLTAFIRPELEQF